VQQPAKRAASQVIRGRLGDARRKSTARRRPANSTTSMLANVVAQPDIEMARLGQDKADVVRLPADVEAQRIGSRCVIRRPGACDLRSPVVSVEQHRCQCGGAPRRGLVQSQQARPLVLAD